MMVSDMTMTGDADMAVVYVSGPDAVSGGGAVPAAEAGDAAGRPQPGTRHDAAV